MHDTEKRCAEVLAAALGKGPVNLVEADVVRPLEGEAEWSDGDGEVRIIVQVSGRVSATFDKWRSSVEIKPGHRPHYWLLVAAMAAVEEARSEAEGGTNEPR